MSTALVVDAVVVGAGPAGSTVACRLAQLGHRVVLLERDPFPRAHIGESIPGSVLPLLKIIGADEPIASAGFLRTQYSLIHWANNNGTLRRKAEGTPHLQADRALFDHILLEHARTYGVQVIQPAKVEVSLAENELWHTRIKDSTIEFTSPVLLDASGRRGLGGKRTRCSPPTLAMYGYFDTDPTQEPVGRIEAIDSGWLWGSPLANGQIATAAFVDSLWLRDHRNQTLESLLRGQFARTRLFQFLAKGRLRSAVLACDASVNIAQDTICDGMIRIGDASLSMDPLSSQGGIMAIASALQAAILANTLLRHPEHRELTEEFARSAQHGRLLQHQRTLSKYYREKHDECDTDFWRIRATHAPKQASQLPLASAECRISLSKASDIKPAPVVFGDIISSATALHHPSLDSPIAYVSGRAINELLDALRDEPSVAQLLERWALRVGEASAVELSSKLWQSGVLTECNANNHSTNTSCHQT